MEPVVVEAEGPSTGCGVVSEEYDVVAEVFAGLGEQAYISIGAGAEGGMHVRVGLEPRATRNSARRRW